MVSSQTADEPMVHVYGIHAYARSSDRLMSALQTLALTLHNLLQGDPGLDYGFTSPQLHMFEAGRHAQLVHPTVSDSGRTRTDRESSVYAA